MVLEVWAGMVYTGADIYMQSIKIQASKFSNNIIMIYVLHIVVRRLN